MTHVSKRPAPSAPAETVRSSTAATVVLRLRPSVYASPTARGIRIRGWKTAFAADGGADLWSLWRRLEPLLRDGVPQEHLQEIGDRPGTWRAAGDLIRGLRDHDMMLTAPAAWWGTDVAEPPGAVVAWLEEVSADPARSWRGLSSGPVTVTGAGAVADAAISALTAAGVGVLTRRAAPDDPRLVVLTAAPGFSVAAGAGRPAGFVTEPAVATAGIARRIADRLGIDAADEAPGPLAAVVGGAAAHRLMCRSAGLPDTAAAERGELPNLDPWPRMLLVRPEPMSAAYHPWLPDGPVAAGPANTLDMVLPRLDALCDEALGVLAPPRYDTLPQVPASLATCHGALGVGLTTGGARLDAALRAAGRAIDPGGRDGLIVGADRTHADGIVLRLAAFAAAGRRAPAVPGSDWRADPNALRWWTTLTVRFGVAARCTVARLADDVFAARVEAAGRELGWAVEATPGGAAAFAAFRAAAGHQARLAGIRDDGALTTACGASPPPFAGHAIPADWARIWPGARPAEDRLQRSLRRILPVTGRPPRPRDGRLWDGLRACGFVIREVGRRDG